MMKHGAWFAAIAARLLQVDTEQQKLRITKEVEERGGWRSVFTWCRVSLPGKSLCELWVCKKNHTEWLPCLFIALPVHLRLDESCCAPFDFKTGRLVL